MAEDISTGVLKIAIHLVVFHQLWTAAIWIRELSLILHIRSSKVSNDVLGLCAPQTCTGLTTNKISPYFDLIPLPQREKGSTYLCYSIIGPFPTLHMKFSTRKKNLSSVQPPVSPRSKIYPLCVSSMRSHTLPMAKFRAMLSGYFS